MSDLDEAAVEEAAKAMLGIAWEHDVSDSQHSDWHEMRPITPEDPRAEYEPHGWARGYQEHWMALARKAIETYLRLAR